MRYKFVAFFLVARFMVILLISIFLTLLIPFFLSPCIFFYLFYLCQFILFLQDRINTLKFETNFFYSMIYSFILFYPFLSFSGPIAPVAIFSYFNKFLSPFITAYNIFLSYNCISLYSYLFFSILFHIFLSLSDPFYIFSIYSVCIGHN